MIGYLGRALSSSVARSRPRYLFIVNVVAFSAGFYFIKLIYNVYVFNIHKGGEVHF